MPLAPYSLLAQRPSADGTSRNGRPAPGTSGRTAV